jgi:hypothetical protein
LGYAAVNVWHDVRSIQNVVTLRLGLVVLIGISAGCSPTLGTLQPARTTPAGHLQLTSSVDYVHTDGEIREAIGIVENADFGGRMTRAEIAEVVDAATVALVQPPSVGGTIAASYGLSKRFELGVRTSGNSLRGHLRFQWLRIAPGVYGSAAFGVSGYFYGFPLHTVSNDAVKVDGFDRWDFDIPLHLGYSSRYFHVWGGPKLIFSTYGSDLTVCTDTRGADCNRYADVTVGGTAAYVTGQLGFAVGYRRFWVAAELTVGRVGASGDVGITSGSRSDDGRYAHEGLVVSPSVGIISWF